MLVHDTHGHGEDEQTGCSGVLRHGRGGRVARRLHRRRHQRHVHRQRRRNGQPAADDGQAARRADPAPAGRVRPGAVRARPTANVGGETDRRRPAPQRPRPGRLDRAQQPRSTCRTWTSDHVPLREQRGRRRRPRGRSRSGSTSPTGPLAATCTLLATGSNTVFTSQTFALSTPVRGAAACTWCSAGRRAGPPRASETSTGSSSPAPASRSSS